MITIIKKYTPFLLKLLITIIVIYSFEDKIDYKNIHISIKNFKLKDIFFIIILISTINIVAATRWYYILRGLGISISWSKALQYFFISQLVSQALPLPIGGDIAKVATISNSPVALRIIGAFLDRLYPIIGLTLIFLFFMWNWILLINERTFLYLFLGTLFLISLFFISIHLYKERTRIGRLNSYLIPLKIFIFNYKNNIYTLIFSIAGFLLLIYLAYYIGSIIGIDLSYSIYLTIFPPILFLAALPISIGGWGVREASTIYIFSYLSIEPNLSFQLSILLGVTIFLGSLPGLFCLLKYKIHNKKRALLDD